MKNVMMLILVVVLVGCSSSPRKRDRWTDPEHRVMILANKVPEVTYVQIQTAIIESNRFFVVDRARGFQAIRAEQTMIHRNDVDRFDDIEKYAWYGKMYSVGAVIIPFETCRPTRNIFGDRTGNSCRQYLSAVDTSTGEVIIATQNVAGVDLNDDPTWDDSVDKFVKSFPRTWQPTQYDSKMVLHRDSTAEHARRQRVALVNEQTKESK